MVEDYSVECFDLLEVKIITQSIIIGNIFTTFDQNWSLISPINLLFYSYDIIYGVELPSNLNSNIIGILLFCIIFLPLLITFIQVYKKEVGR